jgi:hypothetical protein
MASRDDLKALIDQLLEPRLKCFGRCSNTTSTPPPPRPEIEHMQRRSREYKNLVEQRFRETRKPGTIGGMGTHEGTPFGRQSFSY